MRGSASEPEFSFRPLERDDLALLLGWLAAPHVARWWGDLPSDPAVKYCGGQRPVRYFIATLDARPVGMVQIYRWSDFPQHANEVGAQIGEAGVDYLLGEPELIGHGLGPAMLAAFLARFVEGRGEISGVRVDVAQANRRSWRALEKLGFERVGELPSSTTDADSRYVYLRENGDASTRPRAPDIDRVVALARRSSAPAGMLTRVLAIGGPGGAGKSALAIAAARSLSGAPVVHIDDFASWEPAPEWHERVIEQVLRPLASGQPAHYRRYDWDRRALAEWHTVGPSEFLVLEGVIATRNSYLPYLAATVWVTARRDERLRRGVARDGRNSLALWREWMREEDDWIATERPELNVDLVVSGDGPGDPTR